MTNLHLPVVAAVAAGYVAGSIPFAYLAGRLHGVDLRKHGSGNLGATNVARVLGARVGGAVFAADILKGFLPVYFLPSRTGAAHPGLVALMIGAAAILGHVRPIFLLWRGGGKGVATAAGVFVGLAPLATFLALGAWVIAFAASRYVSLASLVAAVALPLALIVTGHTVLDPVFVAAAAVGAFVFATHRSNIVRLMRGEEHRFQRSVHDTAGTGRA